MESFSPKHCSSVGQQCWRFWRVSRGSESGVAWLGVAWRGAARRGMSPLPPTSPLNLKTQIGLGPPEAAAFAIINAANCTDLLHSSLIFKGCIRTFFAAAKYNQLRFPGLLVTIMHQTLYKLHMGGLHAAGTVRSGSTGAYRAELSLDQRQAYRPSLPFPSGGLLTGSSVQYSLCPMTDY